MRPQRLLLAVLSLLTAGALTGCVPPAAVGPQPDLVPVRGAGGQGAEGFCKRVNQGQALVVTVKNVGNARAPESTTEIEFSPGGSFQLPTPALSPAAVFDLPPIDFPVGCFNPDCHFKITVDSKGEVGESDEGNNAADGTCIG